ncbi:hypothetical protein F8S13_19005 [Chloroflexia bacterium SDU3-3]|nr:hypothetical protein F8S13_19005 [Chloroflexia bacterium SDU3-3]
MRKIAAIAAIGAMLSIAMGAQLTSAAPPLADPEPPAHDALTPPPASASSRATIADGASDLPPSAFLAGSIAVRLVFVESDGSKEPSTENWSAEQRAGVERQVRAALDWWEARVPNAHASFTLVSQAAATGYEPISHGLAEEHLWASEALDALGFSGSDHFEQAYAADNAIRSQLHTDWATTIFVINSANDPDGRFSDNYFAYAYVGGPFMVFTSDASSYGFERLPVVISHELGHIFGALDQYESANVPCATRGGYLGVASTNSQYNQCGTSEPSIMLDPVKAYPIGAIDSAALGQVGYRDSDGDHIPDPLDTQPTLSATILPPTGPGMRPEVTAHAADQPFPAMQQRSLSINTISRIEYRTNGGDWTPLPQPGGAFDSADETSVVELPLYDGVQQIELRAINRQGIASPIISQAVSIQGIGSEPAYSIESSAYHNTSDISLDLQVQPGTQIRSSNTLSFGDSPWQAAASSYTHALGSHADGQHTIYIALRDAQGYDLPIITRQVMLDHTAPAGSATLAQNQLQIQAEDMISGIDAVQFGLADGSVSEWKAFQTTFIVRSQPTPKMIWLRDRAGNISAPIPVSSEQSLFLPLVIQ